MDNAISVAMKSVAEHVLLDRGISDHRSLPTYDFNHIAKMRRTLFDKTKKLKEETENLTEKSQCEIKEAEVKQLKSADSE